MANNDHGVLGGGDYLREDGVHVLVVKGLIDFDAIDAQRGCDHLRRLHGANRGTRPHINVVVVLEQREGARIRNLERMPAVWRKLAIKVRRTVPFLLGFTMTHENKGPDHEKTSAD